MESSGSDTDDLADLELSTFKPKDYASGIDRHDDGWYDDKEDERADDDEYDDVVTKPVAYDRRTESSDEKVVEPYHQVECHKGDRSVVEFGVNDENGCGIDHPQSYPIMTGKDWNAGKSLNPFLDLGDDTMLHGGHSTDTTSIDSFSSAHSIPEPNQSPFIDNRNKRQMSPMNPFLTRESTNPFAWNTEGGGENDDYDANNKAAPTDNTEYVYLSRLPEENLGMVLGIDGDQENQRPINCVHVKSITPGGAAARACQGSNRILVGDEIREIDGKALNQLTHDDCIDFFQEMPCNVVLTIVRESTEANIQTQSLNKAPVPKRRKTIDDETEKSQRIVSDGLEHESDTAQLGGLTTHKNNSTHPLGNIGHIPKGFCLVDVTITKEDGQSLGLSVVPSYGATCDLYQIKRLLPEGACGQSGGLEVGDRLLKCNGESLKGLGQSQCLQVLKSSGRLVRLTLLRQEQKQGVVTSESQTSSFPGYTDPIALSTDTRQVVSDSWSVSHSNVSSSPDDLITPNQDSNTVELTTVVDRAPQGKESDTLFEFEEIRTTNDLLIDCTDGNNHDDDDNGVVFNSSHNLGFEESRYEQPSGECLFQIPPPAQFSDSVEPPQHTNVVSSECVTNIDDLLLLDSDAHFDLNNVPPPKVADKQQQDPFVLDIEQNPNPQTLEEFAELCFQNLSHQCSPNPDYDDDFRESLASHTQDISNQRAALPDLISFENKPPTKPVEDETNHITLLPVSSQPDTFVTTIPVLGKDSEQCLVPESAVCTSPSPPYTTNIDIKTSQGNVSIIDVSPAEQLNKSPVSSPRSETPTSYTGSVVFHTYAGSSPLSISSASISLNGDSKPPQKMNSTEEDTDMKPLAVALTHSTIGGESNGDADQIIRPMVVAKNDQGNIFCVQQSDDKTSNGLPTRTISDSDVKELASVMDTFGHNESQILMENNDPSYDISEDEIVPSKLSRDQKESVLSVLDTWQSVGEEKKPTLLETAVQHVIVSNDKFHTTEGVSSTAKSPGEEDPIQPMAVSRNYQGHSLLLPSTAKQIEPAHEKNVSELINVLHEHGVSSLRDSDNPTMDDSDGEGHVSEEDIVPVIFNKKEEETVKNVLQFWGNASSPEKATRFLTTEGVLSTAKSPEEEELIQPMAVTRNPQGQPILLPSSIKRLESEPKKNVSEIINVLRERGELSHTNSDSSEPNESNREENVSEEVIVPTRLSKREEETARNALQSWGTVSPPATSTQFHTTEGVSSTAKCPEEEEPIQPMKVSRNFQGQSMLLPSSAKQAQPLPGKDVSDLISVLNEHDEALPKRPNEKQTSNSEVENHVSEEAIIPTVLTKNEEETVKNVLNIWVNPPSVENVSSVKHKDAVVHNTLGIVNSVKNGGEEDLIQPMKSVKDTSGNPLWLPSSVVVATAGQPVKQRDEGAIKAIADFLNSSEAPVVNGDPNSDFEEIKEEPINAEILFRNDKRLAADAVSKWGSQTDENIDKADSFKLDKSQEQIAETKDLDAIDSASGVLKPSELAHKTAIQISAKPGSEPINSSKFKNAIDVFEKPQNSENKSDAVILRPKVNNPSNFKSKLENFQHISSTGATSDTSRARPRSMVELPSNRSSWSATSSSTRDSGDKRFALKPLSSLRALGSSALMPKESRRPGSTAGLSGASFLPKTQKSGYPKTRQEDGSPFQVDVLAGIVGLGFKLQATPGGYPKIIDVQRSGPLGRSNNVKVGDYLVSVNGTELSGQTDSRVQQILRLLPRGLVKLVVTTQAPSSDQGITPTESQTSNTDSTSNVTVKALGDSTLSASTGDLSLVPSLSKDNLTDEADFSDNVSISSASVENPSLPPVTATIEINPSTNHGSPMKISIKPTPTPRHSAGLPTMSRYQHYASSSANESWDTSSEGSTPRDPSALSKVRKISGLELISNQRKPAGGQIEEKSIFEQDDVRSSGDSSSSTNHQASDTVMKPIEEELIEKSAGSAVNAAPKSTPSKIPPPVAPKPRRTSSSSSSVMSDDSKGLEDSPKIPPPVAPKTRLGSTSSNEKEESPVSTIKTSKISAGYERLQAITKAKQSKPSRIIEKSRANVSSKARMFENEDESKLDLSKERSTSRLEPGRPFNSSLLLANERRKSTGSFSQQMSGPLTRPKSLFPKGSLSKESSIPEQTSPVHDSQDTKSPLSPTRLNSALSPRRKSETPSSVVFTFAPKQAPKVIDSTTTNKTTTEGKVTPNLSTNKKDFIVSPTTSPSLNKALSPSLPPSKLESRSEDSPAFTRSQRSHSVASINLSRNSSVSEEVMEDTMKMFDDLLMDTPVSHTATDPSDILLWAPVRKDSPSSLIKTKTEPAQSLDAKSEVKKPVAPPRKAPVPLPNKSEIENVKSQVSEKAPSLKESPVQEEIIMPKIKAVDSHLPPASFSNDNVEKVSDRTDTVIKRKALLPNYETLLKDNKDLDKNQNILANQMASEILSERFIVRDACANNPNELLLKNYSKLDHETENIPALDIVEAIENDSATPQKESINFNELVSGQLNIPADKLAKEISNDISIEKVGYNAEDILDSSGLDQESNIPASRLAKEIGTDELDDSTQKYSVKCLPELDDKERDKMSNGLNDKYVSQANEIVQIVIAQVSSKPDILLQRKTHDVAEPSSPASSDDEPPPLPGAPPPPIIFRNNTEMLTERAWLDGDETPSESIDIGSKDVDRVSAVVDEEVIQSATSNKVEAAVTSVNDSEKGEELQQINVEPGSESTDLLNFISSQFPDVDMNLVSQNMAQVINHDLLSEDKDLLAGKSDSSERMNSTGESSFQDGDDNRLHSPASVDVLSEDSGMPGDEEFQEVNTDDAISPVNEFRYNDIQNVTQKNSSNVFTAKSPFYHNKEVDASQPTENPITPSDSDFFSSVASDLESSPSPLLSSPPTLPSFPPPCVPAISDSVEEMSFSDPTTPSVSPSQQFSDSHPSSQEASSPGDQSTKPVDDMSGEEVIHREIISVEKKLVHNEIPKEVKLMETNKNHTEQSKLQHNGNDYTNENVNVENKFEDVLKDVITVDSKRQWRLSSNSSNVCPVLKNGRDCVTSVDYTEERLESVLPPKDFVTLLTKANDVLDSLSAPADAQLMVIHIHRDGDSVPLGIDLKADAWYKIISVKADSPLAKEGSVQVGDWLLAVDNLWYPQVSLMRCLARLTKPKHDSLLVISRCQGNHVPTTVESNKERAEIESEKKSAASNLPSPRKDKSHPTPPISPRLEQATRPEVIAKAESPSDTKDETTKPESAEGGMFNVLMMKGATGVGFCLEGGIGSPKGNVPIIIKRIFKGGPAEKCGQLKVKDEIMSVNGVDFTTMRHYEAWNHLKFLDDGEVHFKIRRVE